MGGASSVQRLRWQPMQSVTQLMQCLQLVQLLSVWLNNSHTLWEMSGTMLLHFWSPFLPPCQGAYFLHSRLVSAGSQQGALMMSLHHTGKTDPPSMWVLPQRKVGGTNNDGKLSPMQLFLCHAPALLTW